VYQVGISAVIVVLLFDSIIDCSGTLCFARCNFWRFNTCSLL